MTVRPLIQQWFPAPTIGAESLRERGSPKAYPVVNFLHAWWARRPLTASRAAVVASLLPAWPSDDELTDDDDALRVREGLERHFPGGEKDYHEWFVRSLGILGDPVAARRAIAAARAAGKTTGGNAYGYDRAFTVTPDDETVHKLHDLAALRAAVADPVCVLDPFAGGGSIPFEAARLGCRTIANELNPVAAAILEGTVDVPGRLGPGFASIIESYGARWSKRIEERLAPFFPRVEPDERLAYIWAHTVPCPTTGRPTPLAPNFWLARAGDRKVAVRLDVDREDGEVHIKIVDGKRAAEYGDRSTYKQGAGTSIWTDETFSGDYIKAHAQSGRMGAMLLAVAVSRAGRSGRHFRPPSSDDLAAVEAAEAELARRLPQWEIDGLVPTEEVVDGHKTREARRFGMTRWRDLFTPRQLLTHLTALEALHAVVAEARGELDDERARALALNIAFALDRSLNYNSRLSGWDPNDVGVSNTFDRHDFSFKWSFGEFDGASELSPWTAGYAARNMRNIAKLAHRDTSMLEAERAARAEILLGSAAALPLPDVSVDAIVTDPPYYDNVMYAELADFFYVWLKRSLRDTWPEYCQEILCDRVDEAVANPSLFEDIATYRGRGTRAPGARTARELADERYEELLTQCFREAHRVLKPDGAMTVMFTHKRVDAWDTLGQALLESGFAIASSWPVHTESEHSLHQAKKNSASSTILLTCHKRGSTEPAYWTDLRHEVASAARAAAEEFSAAGLAGIDLTLSTFGPVLSVLSRNWPVFTGELDAEGKSQVLRPDAALDLAREEVARLKKRGLLGGRDVEFDRVTDWYLLAWADFAAAEFPYDEARKLSIATHLELEDLAREYKLIRSATGTVTLLTPAQRRTARAIDPDAASWPALIDALHALMLVYDEDGLQAARAWLERTGKREDAKFLDLFVAALHAIPRVKAKGDFVRPEAATLEHLRQTLFDDVPAPAEADDVEPPPQLFD
jgi:adenine-specific DNA methylase